MRITAITVDKLFGIFDHTIALNLDDRMTIIHGPNGFGKTTLLQMLDGLFNRRYTELRNVPFERFEIAFEDHSALWVESAKAEKAPPEIKVNFQAPGDKRPQSFSLKSPGVALARRRFPLAMLEDMIDGLARVTPDQWVYVPSGQVLSFEDVLDQFGHLLPHEMVGPEQEPSWWQEIQNSVDIHFIRSQRLLNFRGSRSRGKGPEVIAAVTEYSEELAGTIRRKLAESADLSQALDRTFPARLVRQMGQSRITKDELRDKLGELEKKRSRLRDAGLLDKQEDVDFLPSGEIGDYTRDVLSVYVQDVERKLGAFDEIAAKIDLLKRIVSERFLYKQIVISKEDGFIFTTLDGKPLQLTKLSSGEQHVLVLLYQLLFKVKPNSLLLIDEPELSLHIAWQKKFLRDLREITELALFDVLIATHSPQIIADRWDITVKLKGPEML